MNVLALQDTNENQGHIKDLFEEAIGQSIAETEADWKEFFNTMTSDSVSKMTLAYEMSQSFSQRVDPL